MQQTVIQVEYIVGGFDNVVIDAKGIIWRLPYYNAQGKRYKLKELKPFYERNYTAYQIRGKVYSLRQIEAMRRPKKYTVLITDNEVRTIDEWW